MEIIKLNRTQTITIDDNIVVGLGQFDGLHRGHLKLIEKVKKIGKRKDYRTAIITFDPHPDYILGKRQHNGYITPLPDKIKLLEELEIDFLFIIHFDLELSRMEPDEFYERFLKAFQAIVVGSDYRYGYRGKGNIETLKQTGKEVAVVKLLEFEKEKIGSNKIRDLLLEGQVDKIKRLLDRHYYIIGKVTRGSQVGRTLGFKTANVELSEEYQILKKGVYAVYVYIGSKKFLGVCNIGNNPSVNFVERMRLEVHILDFDEDIYNQEIKVEFLKRIRDELKFEKIDDLITQIKKDINYVMERFKI
ncbi:MAG TPA: bifunctional riboflavin kinase/FAD synthetase [Acholeplasmataceae bacterium]|nr:bifunctional riboflavin kinase/FAD synthetase [Acholeplasmataceae bacterium]